MIFTRVTDYYFSNGLVGISSKKLKETIIAVRGG